MMRRTVYLHLRKSSPYAFAIVKMAKTRDAVTRDGDVVLPVQIEVPFGFFDEPAVTIAVQPISGVAR